MVSPPRGTVRSMATVGRVIGTEDATPLEFWVAVGPGAFLQLDDVVALERALPDGRTVHDLRRGQPGAGPARGRALRLRRVPDRGRRPARGGQRGGARSRRPASSPRSSCRRCRARSVERAQGASAGSGAVLRPDGAASCPPGCRGTTSRSTSNLDFLDGTRGAHVNICGISGVATKTSYATFLLYSPLPLGRARRRGGQHQGADLQRQGRGPAVPRPRQHPPRRRGAGQRYAPPRPARRSRSRSVAVYGPAPARTTRTPRPTSPAARSASPRSTGRSPSSVEDELLPFLFADAEDERQQYTMVVHNVDRPAAARRPAPRATAAVRIDGDTVRTFGELVDFIGDRVDGRGRRPDRWAGRAIGGGHGQRVHPPAARRASATLGPPDPRRRARRRGPPSIDVERAGHRRRPAQPPRPGQALRRRRRRCAGRSTRRKRRARPAAAVRRARRAQQVRAARGRPARSRRSCSTSPSAAARSGSSSSAPSRPRARSSGASSPTPPIRVVGRLDAGRGRTRRVRLPAAGAAPAGDDRQAGHDVRHPARDPGAARARVPVPGLGDPSAEAGGQPAPTPPTQPDDPFAGL